MNVKRLIKDAFAIKQKIDSFSAMYSEKIAEIKEYFDANNIRSMVAESETENDIELEAKKSERIIIEYFPEKLKERLDKEIYNEVVIKRYNVNDMPGLIKLLKKHGVNPNDFKTFISTTEVVDKDAIQRLYESGDIGKNDLKGCFSAKVVKSIKIQPHKNDR